MLGAVAGFLGAFGFAGAIVLGSTEGMVVAVLAGLAAGVVVGVLAAVATRHLQARWGRDDSPLIGARRPDRDRDQRHPGSGVRRGQRGGGRSPDQAQRALPRTSGRGQRGDHRRGVVTDLGQLVPRMI